MPIKQSALEKKWYYRIIKVVFLVLPLLYLMFVFINNRSEILSIKQSDFQEILQKNIYYIIFTIFGIIAYYLLLKLIWKILLYVIFGGVINDTVAQTNTLNVAQENKVNFNETLPLIIIAIIFAVIFLSQSGYFKLPKINVSSYGESCKANGKTGMYGTDGKCYTCSSGIISKQKFGNVCSGGAGGVYCCGAGLDIDLDDFTSKCVSTGCDHLWFCSGKYYIGGQAISVPGMCYPTEARKIYPSWEGTCRQCP